MGTVMGDAKAGDLDDAVFGKASHRNWVDYGVKGNLVASRPRYVRETWGEAVFRDVGARLERDTRALFDSPVLTFAWVPCRTLAAIDYAIISGPMHGDASLMKPFGATIARYDLPTLYKMLFKLGTPSFFLKRASVLYKTYFRGGELSPVEVTANALTIRVVSGDLPHYLCRYGISGFLTAAVELSGGKHVHVEEVACVHRGGAHCTWHGTWR